MEELTSGYYVADCGTKVSRYFELEADADVYRSAMGWEWTDDYTVEYKAD